MERIGDDFEMLDLSSKKFSNFKKFFMVSTKMVFGIGFSFCIAPCYTYVEIIKIGFSLDCLIF